MTRQRDIVLTAMRRLLPTIVCLAFCITSASAFGLLSYFKGKQGALLTKTGVDVCLQDACTAPSATLAALRLLTCLTDGKYYRSENAPSLELLLTKGLTGLCSIESSNLVHKEATQTAERLKEDANLLLHLNPVLSRTKTKLARSRETIRDLQGTLRNAFDDLIASHKITSVGVGQVAKEIEDTLSSVSAQEEVSSRLPNQRMISSTRQVLQRTRNAKYFLRENTQLVGSDRDIVMSIVHACIFVIFASIDLRIPGNMPPFLNRFLCILVVCDVLVSFGLCHILYRSLFLMLFRCFGLGGVILALCQKLIRYTLKSPKRRNRTSVVEDTSKCT